MSPAEATEARTYGNLVAGEWRDARGEQTFDSVNPARRAEVVGHFARGGARDIELAVQAALAAQPEWARTPVPARAEIDRLVNTANAPEIAMPWPAIPSVT